MNSPGSHTPLERASLHHPHAVLRKLHPHISMELDPGHSSITANCPAWPSDLNTNKPERYRAASADGAQDRVGRGLSVGAAWRTATPESWPETPLGIPQLLPRASWAPENITFHPPPQTIFSESQGRPCSPSNEGARCPDPHVLLRPCLDRGRKVSKPRRPQIPQGTPPSEEATPHHQSTYTRANVK